MGRDRASRPEARPLRLFVAVDIPEPVRQGLAEVVTPWRERYPRGRWVPPENWHVTLKFLGSTWPRLLEWVMDTVDAVARAASPIDSRLEGLGAFPSTRRARVLWAGLEDPGGRLGTIATALDRELAREFKQENRPFTAHLTVARFDPPVALGDELAATEVGSEPFPIDRLVLYRSHLRRPAPVYEPLREFRLGGEDRSARPLPRQPS